MSKLYSSIMLCALFFSYHLSKAVCVGTGDGFVALEGGEVNSICYDGNNVINIGNFIIYELSITGFKSSENFEKFDIIPPTGFKFVADNETIVVANFIDDLIDVTQNVTENLIGINYKITGDSEFNSIIVKNLRLKRTGNDASTHEIQYRDYAGLLLPDCDIKTIGSFSIIKHGLGIHNSKEMNATELTWCKGEDLIFTASGGDGTNNFNVSNGESDEDYLNMSEINIKDIIDDFPDEEGPLTIYAQDWVDGCKAVSNKVTINIQDIQLNFAPDKNNVFSYNNDDVPLKDYVIGADEEDLINDNELTISGNGVFYENNEYVFKPAAFNLNVGESQQADVVFTRNGDDGCTTSKTLEMKVYRGKIDLGATLCAFEPGGEESVEFKLTKSSINFLPDPEPVWTLKLEAYNDGQYFDLDELNHIVKVGEFIAEINENDNTITYILNLKKITEEKYTKLRIISEVTGDLFVIGTKTFTLATHIVDIIYTDFGGFNNLNEEYCIEQEFVEFEILNPADVITTKVDGEEKNGLVECDDLDCILDLNNLEIADNKSSVNIEISYEVASCTNVIFTNVIIRKTPIAPTIKDTPYCLGDKVEPIDFSGYVENNATLHWYLAGDKVSSGNEFFPLINTDIPQQTTFQVKKEKNGCLSEPKLVNFVVFAEPEVELKELPTTTFCNTPGEVFDLSPYLMSEDIEEGAYRSLVIMGTNIENDTLSENKLIPSKYQPGSYILRYLQANNTGCVGTDDHKIEIIDWKPVVEFSFDDPCLGQQVNFVNQTTIEDTQVLSWKWYIDDKEVGDSKDYTHMFNETGVYEVKLALKTIGLCKNEIIKYVSVFPHFSITADAPYIEKFDSADHHWIQSGQTKRGANSSWNILSEMGSYWQTNNGQNTYNGDERSWVESPCFDLSQLDRPMLSFNYNMALQDRVDGVVMEYTIDNGQTWHTLGDEGSGVNWFNARGITTTPGVQGGASVGWTGVTQDTTWQTARIALDQVRTEALGLSTFVRFRFALASNESNPDNILSYGFAFDDVFIGNRNKNIFLEHFTNINEVDDTPYLLDWTSDKSDVLFVNYHIDVPGESSDPLYLDNTATPSARALHHGVSTAGRSIINGEFVSDDPFKNWGNAKYEYEKLKEAPFSIELNVNSGNMTASVQRIFNNIDSMALDNVLVVQMAIIEKNMEVAGKNAFHVVKTLLPSPAGTRITGGWEVGITKQFEQPISLSLEQNSKYFAVVFVEGAMSKKIYQMEYVSFMGGDASIADRVFVNQIENEGNSYVLWPNPTSAVTNISFSKSQDNINWAIYDVRGINVKQGYQAKGRELAISVNDLKSGLYFIEIYTDLIENAKEVMVVK